MGRVRVTAAVARPPSAESIAGDRLVEHEEFSVSEDSRPRGMM